MDQGRITRYVVADSVGTITLDDGREVRFGQSACRGFSPSEGLRVTVGQVGPHPLGGLRATGIELAAGEQAAYELRRHASAPVAADPPPPAAAPPDLEPLYRELQITVLLDRALPTTRDKIEAAIRLPGLSVEVHPGANGHTPLTLRYGPHSLMAHLHARPFPVERIDRRLLPAGHPPGVGWLGIVGPVMPLWRLRPVLGPTLPDPWGESGLARALSRIAVRLCVTVGRTVVLNYAGELARSGDEFVTLCGDLDDPGCRPFAAWLDVAYTMDHGALRTFGMEVFGLPDLVATVPTDEDGPGDDAAYAAARDALMYAAFVMTRENRALTDGERLDVPRGLEVDPWELRHDATPAQPWSAMLRDGVCHLSLSRE